MMRIVEVIAVPGVGAYYNEDLEALQARPIPLGDRYTTEPVTPGFRHVREVAEALSVGLVLEDASAGAGPLQIAWGDCVGVAYSGKAGRDPVFRAEEGAAIIQGIVAPALLGRTLGGFRELAADIDALIESAPPPEPEPDPDAPPETLTRRDLLTSPVSVLRAIREELEQSTAPPKPPAPQPAKPAHTALRYGVSQALLQAVALSKGVTMAEVISEEWGLPLPDQPVPIHAQSGSEFYHNADKMIARRVASLPHILVDNIQVQLGSDGGKLTQYVRWLKKRLDDLGGPDYLPTIHLDVHGALGKVCQNNLGKVFGKLYGLETAAKPYPLRVESPVIMDTREEQIKAMRRLREYVRTRNDMSLKLVVDEWANTLDDIWAFVNAMSVDMVQIKMPNLGGVHNTIEAVAKCKYGGVMPFLGGSCAETDVSARVAVHVALATRPEMILARPGMGVDEAVSLVQNEMARTLAWIKLRRGR